MIEYLKIASKEVALFIFGLSGLFYLTRYLNREKITVMMLHGVKRKDYDSSWQPLRPQMDIDVFKKNLQILSKHYNFISLSHAVDIITGDRPPVNNALVVTMDDGYKSQFLWALPVCNEYEIIPTIYIVTSKTDNPSAFWFDHLDFAMQKLKKSGLSLNVGDKTFVLDVSSREELGRSFKDFRDYCKTIYSSDKEFYKYMEEVAARLELESESGLSDIFNNDMCSLTADWDFIRSCLSSYQFEVGSHTMSHYRLDKLSDSEALYELKQSKGSIEAELGVVCKHFCYPNGDYSDDVVSLVEKSGYLSATTTEKGVNRVADDKYKIKRIHFPDTVHKNRLHYKLNIAHSRGWRVKITNIFRKRGGRYVS